MKIYEPKLVVLENEVVLDQYMVDLVVEQICLQKDSVLTLPTGNTPLGMYKGLVDVYRNGKVSFDKVRICNLDEYWPIERNSPDSYYSYMRNNFVDLVDLPSENWFIPNGECVDPDVEAKRFDNLVSKLQVDLAVVGLGPGLTCHVGFNEPGGEFDSRTRLVELHATTKEVNSKLFRDETTSVSSAITQGLGTIMEAKRIVLMAKGKGKAEGVRRFLKGKVGVGAPASVLRTREQVEVVLDREAAGLL